MLAAPSGGREPEILPPPADMVRIRRQYAIPSNLAATPYRDSFQPYAHQIVDAEYLSHKLDALRFGMLLHEYGTGKTIIMALTLLFRPRR